MTPLQRSQRNCTLLRSVATWSDRVTRKKGELGAYALSSPFSERFYSPTMVSRATAF